VNRAFYVSAIDGDRKALICGPYETHEAALEDVTRVKRAAERVDHRAVWWAWGTASVNVDEAPEWRDRAGSLGRPEDL
jgi:hypothetical protein